MNDNNDIDGKPYAVGYKKPPKATQFKKGNTAQRQPKQTQKASLTPPGSIEEMFAQALLQPVTMKKGNKTSKVPFLEAFTRSLVASLSTATLKDKMDVIKYISKTTILNDQISAMISPPPSFSYFTAEQEANFLKMDEEFRIYGDSYDDVADETPDTQINDLDEGSV